MTFWTQIFLSTLCRRARRGLGHGAGVICETVERSLAQRGYDMRPIMVASAISARRAMKRDLYAEVSTRIVAELEAGAAPWGKPWSATPGCSIPVHVVNSI
jgi:N-terminal domain of anti-restriction factor ArdC